MAETASGASLHIQPLGILYSLKRLNDIRIGGSLCWFKNMGSHERRQRIQRTATWI